jgi:hypothetical protein
MRCFWEQTGVLGPINRAVGEGLNDRVSGPLFLSHFHGEFPTVCEPGKSPFKAI